MILPLIPLKTFRKTNQWCYWWLFNSYSIVNLWGITEEADNQLKTAGLSEELFMHGSFRSLYPLPFEVYNQNKAEIIGRYATLEEAKRAIVWGDK